MSQVLDAIVKKKILEGPESISSTTITESFDMSGVENAFSIQIEYLNGIGLDMDLFLEVSTNGQSYSRIDESIQNVTDTSGSHIWDVSEQGVNFIRVAFVINSGSCDIEVVEFSGKRRH